MSTFDQLLIPVSRTGRLGTNLVRISIAIVFIWIGLLKFVPFEADSITPMVARSPFMSFFYKHPEQYKEHMTQEGQLVPAARAWQEENNTYRFARGLGSTELFIAFLVLLNPLSRKAGLAGGLLSWVPALGDAQHGFPYLSGMGRLIIKDTIMLAGAVVVMADSARTLLQEREVRLGAM
jgi:reactive chlorine resistance protein C